MAELAGNADAVRQVKEGILWGLLVLIPAMVAAGASGAAMAGQVRSGAVAAKRRRMVMAGLNGALVLLPCAVFLAIKAKAGHFDGYFYAVQVLELVFATLQLTLLGLNARDGMKLARQRTKPRLAGSAAR